MHVSSKEILSLSRNFKSFKMMSQAFELHNKKFLHSKDVENITLGC